MDFRLKKSTAEGKLFFYVQSSEFNSLSPEKNHQKIIFGHYFLILRSAVNSDRFPCLVVKYLLAPTANPQQLLRAGGLGFQQDRRLAEFFQERMGAKFHHAILPGIYIHLQITPA
jgi:hypothetical protein